MTIFTRNPTHISIPRTGQALLALTVLFFSALLCVGASEKDSKKNEYQSPSSSSSQRSFSVVDSIEMTEFGTSAYLGGISAKYDVALFSPDGLRFVILVKKGNLKLNANDYSLLLYRSEEAFQSPPQHVLVSMSSSSNRPGIQDVRWLENRTIIFLGVDDSGTQQIYTVDCETMRVDKLTSHNTNVVDYAATADGDEIFFAAEQPWKSFFDERTRRAGFIVSTQPLSDLMSGENRMVSELYLSLFSKRKGESHERLLKDSELVSATPLLWLSPDGRNLVLKTMPTEIPESWRNYKDRLLQMRILEDNSSGAPHFVYRYDLMDTMSGKCQPLVDAPIGKGHSEVAWSSDSQSVVLSGTYLPLGVSSSSERVIRESARFIAEIKVSNHEIIPIGQEEAKLHAWDWATNRLLLESTARFATADPSGDIFAYQKTSSGWKRVQGEPSDLRGNRWLSVTLREDMNTPPRVFVESYQTGKEQLLFDLNPSFAQLRFGRVREVIFKTVKGMEVKGGLYLPVGYVPGKRCPLVIQTHGWNPERFWPDGPYTSGFAAQALAGEGIAVLQLQEDLSKESTLEGVQDETLAYEATIDYLDRIGLIDRDRVGLIGFSATGLSVKYALTHSKYHFAAASIADGSDGGYFQYLSNVLSWPPQAADSEGVNGGPPFGAGLDLWIQRSPGFSLGNVTTPVRLEAYHPESLLYAWEWFSGLRRLGKPVELIYMPDADHVLVKPWDRRTSQEGNVDWFCFWLKGELHSDQAKVDQYARWTKLRELNDSSAKTRAAKNLSSN